jgi:hypothetical protein
MKPTHIIRTVIVVMLLGILPRVINGQTSQSHFGIKVNPLSLFYSALNVSAEVVIALKTSLQVGVFLLDQGFSGTRYEGLGITPELRFYFSKYRAPMGWYAGPYIRAVNFGLSVTDYTASLISVSAGVTLGYQYVFSSGVSLSAFTGIGVGQTNFIGGGSNKDHFDYDAYGNTGFGLDRSRLFGVSVGYFF